MLPDWLVTVGAIAFAWTVWALLLWGAIALFERDNPVNRFSEALGWSVLHIVVSLTTDASWMLEVAVVVGWFTFLVRLLIHRYELGLLHAIGVVIATVAAPYAIEAGLEPVVGASEVAAYAVLFGVPAAILGGWQWRRRRAAGPGDDWRRETLPTARVARFRRRARSPVATASPAPAAPAVARPVATASPPPATDGREPSILK